MVNNYYKIDFIPQKKYYLLFFLGFCFLSLFFVCNNLLFREINFYELIIFRSYLFFSVRFCKSKFFSGFYYSLDMNYLIFYVLFTIFRRQKLFFMGFLRFFFGFILFFLGFLDFLLDFS